MGEGEETNIFIALGHLSHCCLLNSFIKKTFFGVLGSKNRSVKKGVKWGECGGLRKDLLLGELVKEGCVKEKGGEMSLMLH